MNSGDSTIKIVTSKQMLTKNSDQPSPIIMSDQFTYDKTNGKVFIARDTQMDDKRRLVVAKSNGGPYQVVERVIDGEEKKNTAYKVSNESIPDFMVPSLQKMSNRKDIKKCNSQIKQLSKK